MNFHGFYFVAETKSREKATHIADSRLFSFILWRFQIVRAENAAAPHFSFLT